MDGIDPEFIAALPPDIRDEVLEQQRRERRRRQAAAQREAARVRACLAYNREGNANIGGLIRVKHPCCNAGRGRSILSIIAGLVGVHAKHATNQVACNLSGRTWTNDAAAHSAQI